MLILYKLPFLLTLLSARLRPGAPFESTPTLWLCGSTRQTFRAVFSPFSNTEIQANLNLSRL